MENKNLFIVFILFLAVSCRSGEETAVVATTDSLYGEPHRPQVHFSPPEKWMNDPNGMVYHDGNYHLFYQYFPDSTVWGPMHWGHAISSDLVHWQHLPVAIYPDSLGYIFSGSTVVDKENTSGLGTKENPPLVAIFTYHSVEKERAGRNDYQTQGLAYSIDSGKSWVKYPANPILKNPGIKDFRDPKVFWHEESRTWIMVLAVQDHIEFYGSPNLMSWSKLSEFGKDAGAHGGVWECPDLFQLPIEGSDEKQWVLLVSINPGGPNGGSGTQYFVGDFDGKDFRVTRNWGETNWLDYGPDNYAGVTWSNAPDDRKIFLGWMSNWAYAQDVPTQKWRGAMTVPRELKLHRRGLKRYVTSLPVPEVKRFAGIDEKEIPGETLKTNELALSMIEGQLFADSFQYIEFSNSKGQSLKIGYELDKNQFYIDRSEAGNNTFSAAFNGRSISPRHAKDEMIPFTLIMDVSSVEVFFDDGFTVMTATFFPDEPLTKFVMVGEGDVFSIDSVKSTRLKSIWSTPQKSF
jgi:fructan beta-fructosidase